MRPRTRPGSVRWLVLKDVAILRRSPLLVAILVLYPIALALMIGIALAAPPAKPRVAVYSGVPASGRSPGGVHLDLGAATRQLAAKVTPVHVGSEAAALADVRAGRVAAAVIIPASIVAQIDSLIRTGFGSPTIRLVLNDRDPIERDLVASQIQTQVDDLETTLSRELLGTALGDLHTVVAGGALDAAGQTVDLLGLSRARTIASRAIAALAALPRDRPLTAGLRQVVAFADVAIAGLSFAGPVLGQLHSPLTVTRSELNGRATPTDAYAVAIAVSLSELFLAMLLAAALLALERSEGTYARLVRGPVSASGLLVAKGLLAAAAAAMVALVMSAVVSLFVGVEWSRFALWVPAILLAGAAFAALGLALGALAREVAAASLLAILVGLPVAFLALVPSQAVASGVGSVLTVISFVFPFRAGLEAVTGALSGTGPDLLGPFAHLAALALAYGTLARLALRRFAA